MATSLSASRRTAAVIIALVATIGCAGDAALAPTPMTPDAPTALAAAQNVSALGFQSGNDTIIAKWRIPVNQPSVHLLGAHIVTFPARAICEPGSSSYGPEFWDAPCEPAKKVVQLSVRSWMDKNGLLQLSFTPDIRFVPSADPDNWVMLYMKERLATTQTEGSTATASILWVPKTNALPVDEALLDPTLRTQASPYSGYLFRRIKHFSGYTVAAGRTSVTVDVEVGLADTGL